MTTVNSVDGSNANVPMMVISHRVVGVDVGGTFKEVFFHDPRIRSEGGKGHFKLRQVTGLTAWMLR